MLRLYPFVLLVLLAGVLLAGVLPAGVASAQDGRLLHAEDETYLVLKRLQERGHLQSLAPNTLPYTFGAIARAVAAEDRESADPVVQRWLRLVEQRVGTPEDSTARAGVMITGGLKGAQNRRLDVMRYIDAPRPVYVFSTGSAWIADRGFTANLGLTGDYFYDVDPDGIDTALRPYLRSENGYIGYETGLLGVHLGRVSEHWGLAGRPGLMLSSNPRSFDLLKFRFGGPRLQISSVVGELDSITGDERFTGIAGDDSVASGKEARFISAHRLDWRPKDNIIVTLMEATIYSGSGAGFSLTYLNPMQFMAWLVDNSPKNQENNGMIGAALWTQFGRTTIEGQFILDDIDYLDRKEPMSFAFAGSVTQAAVRPALDVGADLTAVASRTYNAFQPEGRWVYLDRGIGTAFPDFVETSLHGSWYADRLLGGLTVEPYLAILWQGDRTLRTPYEEIGDFAGILSGTVERTIRSAVRFSYHPDARLHFTLDAGFNQTRNDGFVSGVDENRWLIQAAGRFRLFVDDGISWN